jgi:hypothetical protein
VIPPLSTLVPKIVAHLGFTDLVAFHEDIARRVITCTPAGPWIAGGCWLRRLGEHKYPAGGDIDVFCASDRQVAAVCARLEELGGTMPAAPSSWSRKYTLPNWQEWNVITRPYSSLVSCLLDFDYTICQWAWDGTHMWLGTDTLAHVESRELVPVTTRSAERQFNRMLSYHARGYTPSHLARDAMFAAVKAGKVSPADEDKDGSDYE